jgi:hypothetical protein
VTMLATGFAAVVSLLRRLGRARGEERQQLKWFAYATALVVLGFIPLNFIPTVGPLILIAALLGIPLSVGIAILRYQLYDIDVVINRTLVYGALTAALVAVYVGSVVLLQGLLRPVTGQGNDLAIIASTLAIAALFNPLRHRIQDFIDRRFYRRKYDAAQVLAAFSATVRDEVDADKLREHLLDAVQETMQPTHVSLWLRPVERTRLPPPD